MSTAHDRRGPGVLCLAAGVMLLLAKPVAGDPPMDRLVLAPGVPVERTLGPGGVDRFALALTAGKPWRVRVEQLGVDVVVEVKGPPGESLLRVDTPFGREGQESLLLRPEFAGIYGVEVRCETRGAPAGRYVIRLDELPSATPVDQLRLRAEEVSTDAGRLYAADTDDARQRALARLEEVRELWQSVGDRHALARTWLLLGKLAAQLDDYRRAVAAYEEALALWRQLGERRGASAALAGLGAAHNLLGENAKAVSDLEEALALRPDEQAAEVRNELCLALQRLGRWSDASACYEQVLAAARELGDTGLEALVLNNLGGIASNLGEPEPALAYFNQALDLRRALGDEVGEGVALNNLGGLYHDLGEVEEALLSYGQALAIFERDGNRYWQARTLNNVGFAYLGLGDLERARAYLLRAIPLRRELGDQLGEAVTLRNLGRTYSRLGEAGKALAFFRKALERSLAVGDRRGAATARKLLGELETAQGEPAAARVALELALESLRQMGKRPEEAEVLELLSRVHLALGELETAAELAGRALALHRAVRSPLGEVQALTSLARAERRQGQAAAARTALESALAALEGVHARLGDPSQRAAFLGSQREVYELYVDTLMELDRREPGRGHDLAALAASERARSRSLLGLLEAAGAGLGRDVEPALRERLRLAERRFAAKTRRQLQLLGGDHAPEQALAVEQELYAALADLDNVRAEIRRRSPRYAALETPPALDAAQTVDAAAVRALLDDGTVLLEFLLGEERSFLWWVTPTSVATFELPPRQRIEELAEQVHRQVSAIHGRTGAVKESLAALGRMLLDPVADRLQGLKEGARLVIVADGALHAVPFAALTLPRSGEPVLARYEVVYLPSASVLAAQRRELPGRSAAAKTAAIFADPIFTRRDPRLGGTIAEASRDHARSGLAELDRLPNTRREAEAIAALVPADQRLLALDGDARRSRVVDGGLADYRILHFATHGVFDPRLPELSGLMLSRLDAAGHELDGFLGLYDVANLELSADLVVLSGCGTALGKEVRGEGLIGLTRGFMYAGVPRVVSSLWQVRDQATAELMARFYRAMLVEDLPPAAALRAAQLGLRQERRFRDPFYWAAFALQGEWR